MYTAETAVLIMILSWTKVLARHGQVVKMHDLY